MECGENMKREINGELLNVPEHVAVIMDGNGRWAKKRFLPRNYGHAEGCLLYTLTLPTKRIV